jgi:hypothetical protein
VRLRPSLFSIALALPALLATAPAAPAAASESGRPLIRTFNRVEHKAYTQFWAPFQSEEGLVYFGN